MATSVIGTAQTGTIGVLELGTNSLKLHLFRDDIDADEPSRVEWDVGFEVYSSRRISDETMVSALSQVRSLLGSHGIEPSSTPVCGIATGAFRDAENTEELLQRLERQEGIPVRILNSQEEASLLIEGSSRLVPERPGMAFDLGGGSLDMVYFGSNGSWIREDLPLGAIRLYNMASLASGGWDEGPAVRWIETTLRNARAFQLPSIHGTGGTVKAIAQVAGTASIPIEQLRALEEDARSDGVPPCLTLRRRTLFLPGILVVRRLVEHVGAKTLRYTRVDLGEVLLSRLKPFRGALRETGCRSILFQHLDLFRSDAPPSLSSESPAPDSGPAAGPLKAPPARPRGRKKGPAPRRRKKRGPNRKGGGRRTRR